MSGTYEDLEAWQMAMDLVFGVYEATQMFPRHEVYGLTSQIRRAAVSVPSNIAEGKGRNSDKELVQFLNRARGSLYELQTQLKIAQHLGYVDPYRAQRLRSQADRTGQLLNGLIRSFRATALPSVPDSR